MKKKEENQGAGLLLMFVAICIGVVGKLLNKLEPSDFVHTIRGMVFLCSWVIAGVGAAFFEFPLAFSKTKSDSVKGNISLALIMIIMGYLSLIVVGAAELFDNKKER